MICIPITATKTKEALKDIKKAQEIADIIEIRLDINPDIELLRRVKKPVIATCRRKAEGGRFKGGEKKRLELLKKAILLNPDFVDIELNSGPKAIEEIKGLIKHRKTKLIISFHDTKAVDKRRISRAYQSIKRSGPDVIKIAGFASSIDDNAAIFGLIKKAKKDKTKIIAICMGDKGELSRVLGVPLGCFLTFGSLGEGKESAPGQISAEVLKNVYRVNKLKDPKVFGLVGNPVNKSKGYLIHNASFTKKRLNAIYVNFLVDDVSSFINIYRDLFSGLSVTMPFKEGVINSLDKIDKTTGMIGAVNTVVKRNGRLKGYNTDYLGAVKALKQRIRLKGKKAMIIGAGGVSKAIGYGLKSEGAEVFVTDIDTVKGKKLAKAAGFIFFKPEDIENIGADIMINATPVGMYPKVDRMPVDASVFRKGMVVFDCIYNPRMTKMLKVAKRKGAKGISGIELFVNQAALQFELWTKKNAPIKMMNNLLK